MPPCDLYQRYSQTTTIATLTPRDSRWSACLRVIEGHTYWVRSVGFSSHGRWIVSASDDETVRTWDSRSGNLLNTMESNGRSAGISPDNQRIASGSRDGSIDIWNATSGALISRLYSQSEDMQNVQVRSVAFAPDGRTIIAGIAFVTERRSEPQPPSGTILMWDLIDGKCLRAAQVPAKFEVIHSVAYSLDGASIVTASDDGLVRTWDLMLSVLQTLRGHTAKSYCAAFFPNGTKIASCSADRTTRIWSVGAAACMKVLEGHEGNVTCVAISSPGDRIASGSHDRTVRLWDAHSGECLAVMQDHTDRVCSICISSDGSRLASASEDHTIRVWDLQAATAGFDRMLGHTTGTMIVCCAFSPDGTQLASSDMHGTIVFWDNALLRNADRSHCSDSGALDTRCSPQEDAPSNFSRSEMWTPYKSMRWGHSRIDRVAFSPDGTMFAVCNRYSVGIWSIAGFTFLRRIKVGMENIEVVLWLGFSSDSTRIYACFNNAGAKHVTWSCTTGEVVDNPVDSRNLAPMEVQFCEKKGWIIEQVTGRKLCWLTDSKRASRISRGRLKAEACHGTYYAAGSPVGRVTILDLCALVKSEE
ncbi:WD40 repeat-like protein [Wolfiporia cocos MD-104 SS10]|uniref:WD40 repeat-like protein n=1 Tax=Wolfiporia cocos (strain MD-104) TaxID=742152 RepID=A0A2H3JH03_WOLCO|nr:WD40 repeat-like protein [Wolfiporia cocos MD-104 SS10]